MDLLSEIFFIPSLSQGRVLAYAPVHTCQSREWILAAGFFLGIERVAWINCIGLSLPSSWAAREPGMRRAYALGPTKVVTKLCIRGARCLCVRSRCATGL